MLGPLSVSVLAALFIVSVFPLPASAPPKVLLALLV